MDDRKTPGEASLLAAGVVEDGTDKNETSTGRRGSMATTTTQVRGGGRIRHAEIDMGSARNPMRMPYVFLHRYRQNDTAGGATCHGNTQDCL